MCVYELLSAWMCGLCFGASSKNDNGTFELRPDHAFIVIPLALPWSLILYRKYSWLF